MSLFHHWRHGGQKLAGGILAPRRRFPRDKHEILSIKTRMLRPLNITLALLSLAVTAQAASSAAPLVPSSLEEFPDRIIVSVKDQKLMLVRANKKVAVYPVSTS